jgi:hypothetical protein
MSARPNRLTRRLWNTEPMHVARLVAAALDPLMTRCGFSAGQTGLPPENARWPAGAGAAASEDSGAVLWCGGYETLKERQPGLPQATGQDDQGAHACVDFTVALLGRRITAGDFEGLSLSDTFATIGMPQQAEESARLVDAPLDEALSE